MMHNVSYDPIPLAPPKSLSQMAAEAAAQSPAGVNPWACTRCGCNDWRVAGTYELNGKRRRQRVCRNCQTPMRTLEIPVPPGHDVVVVPSAPAPAELLPPPRAGNTALAPAERTKPTLPVIPELPDLAFQPEETAALPAKKKRKKAGRSSR